jgi:hypothetical protein
MWTTWHCCTSSKNFNCQDKLRGGCCYFFIQFCNGVQTKVLSFCGGCFLTTTKNLGIPNITTNASLFILQSEWMQEIHTYISTRNFLEGYSIEQWKKLVLKALTFTIIDGHFYKQRQDQIFYRCLRDGKISIILWEMHKGLGGRHFSTNIIV